ncbi:MAG: hypothetical protein JRD89_00340 [Deltaproteobacteria bacterium]|nr:hypothetical protein [Deltaproteobacteria bacterium]
MRNAAYRYYRIKARVGHQGAGKFSVANYYWRTTKPPAEVWQAALEHLPGVKRVLEVEEIGFEEYWRNRVRIAREKRQHEGPPTKCVLVTGVFALLTPNHVRLLEAVRRKYPRPEWELVVGTNGDKRAGELKWYSVLPASLRAEILESIRYVDRVIVFDTPDATGALMKVLPDVWIKGGDWRGKPLPEKAFCELIGCQIDFIGPFKGLHASDIAEAIARRWQKCQKQSPSA